MSLNQTLLHQSGGEKDKGNLNDKTSEKYTSEQYYKYFAKGIQPSTLRVDFIVVQTPVRGAHELLPLIVKS